MESNMKNVAVIATALLIAFAVGRCGPEDEVEYYYDWSESTLEAENIDPAIFNAAVNAIEARPDIYSFLVVRHGKLVQESYMNDADGRIRWHVRSVTKSVVSALVGVALEEGYIDSVQEPISNHMSQFYLDKVREENHSITIQNILTMTSGIEWTEAGTSENPMFQSNDFFEYYLNLRQENPPGEVFEYSTGGPHVLSGVLRYATGMDLGELADKYMFEPLGIPDYSWASAPDYVNIGGYGLYLTPRDMARFGYLYLEDGVIDGERIFPEGWVAETFTPRVTKTSYGYLWWIKDLGQYDGYAAQGAEGQMIYLFPDYDLIIVFTGVVTSEMPVLDNIVEYDVLPAINAD